MEDGKSAPEDVQAHKDLNLTAEKERARLSRIVDGQQLAFGRLQQDPSWGLPNPRSLGGARIDFKVSVQMELAKFERAVLTQGITHARSAHAYRRALTGCVRSAQRALGRQIDSLEDLFTTDVIAAIARDDTPSSTKTDRLSRSTKQLERVVLRTYVRAIGVAGRTFNECNATIDRGLRLAAKRKGSRYRLLAGRPKEHGGSIPSLEDAKRFLQIAESEAFPSLEGLRLSAAAALTLFHGLRTKSVIVIEGGDFEWRREKLLLAITEKLVKGKPRRRTVEVCLPVVRRLLAWVNAYNTQVHRAGRSVSVGFGVPGAFFRLGNGRPWNDGSMREAYALCCERAGVDPFPPRALRRLYASGLADRLSAEEAALAGGWKGAGVFLRNYARSLGSWRRPLPGLEPKTPGESQDRRETVSERRKDVERAR